MSTRALDAALLAAAAAPAYNTSECHTPMKVDRRVSTLHDFLKTTPLFAGIPPDELSILAKDFVPIRFRQGQTIFHQGDAGELLYLIQSGRVRIFVHGADGQETSVIIYGPGDMFGELAVIDEMPRSASVAAMEETVVLTLSRDRFREHTRKSSQLALNFMKLLSVRLRYSTQQVGSLTFLDVPGRLARKLLELATDYGVAEDSGVRINTLLTQTDLAQLIGATRESTNKVLGAFRRRGWVVMRQGSIVIVDPDALREEVRL